MNTDASLKQYTLRLSILYAIHDAYVATERMSQDEWTKDLSIEKMARLRVSELVNRTMGMSFDEVDEESIEMAITPVVSAIARSIDSEDLWPLMQQRIALTPDLQGFHETIRQNWPDDEWEQDIIMWMSNADLKQLIKSWAKD